MTKMDVHYSNKTPIWEVPQDLIDKLNAEFNFGTDVCALPENKKVNRYYTPDQDGLSQQWTRTCWMNPPYGRQIGKWVKKAHDSALQEQRLFVFFPAVETRAGGMIM